MSSNPQVLRPVNEITKFAEIFQPQDAEPPILSPAVRLVMRQWMTELSAEEELHDYGLKPRRTALLCGPPGCGKTTLAHHFAARLGLPLVVVNMAAILSKWVNQSAEQINKFFEAADEQSDRMVLLLDEFDCIAGKRIDGETSAAKEKNNIVIALLQRMDRFKGTIIAATNRGEDIDPAIWRRFGMQLQLIEPDDEARYAILTRYLQPLTLPEEAMGLLAEMTVGASPAVLRQLMEGVKRDLILAPRYGQTTDAPSIFERLKVSVRPHAGSTLPPFWTESWPMESLNKISWPPHDPRKEPKPANDYEEAA